MSAFSLIIEREGIEFESMVDQAISELTRHLGLQTLDLHGFEFDHFAGTQIDEMIVVTLAQLLIARSAGTKIMSLHNTGILEQLDGAVHRRDRNPAVDQGTTAKQFLDIRVIPGSGQDARNDSPLLGHAHALGNALSLDVIDLQVRHPEHRGEWGESKFVRTILK
jgi:hypothetical protein